jgi:hypothetical protein
MITGIYLKGSVFSFASTYISWFHTLHSWQKIHSPSLTHSTLQYLKKQATRMSNFAGDLFVTMLLSSALVCISLTKSLRVIQQAFRIIPVKEELSTSFN